MYQWSKPWTITHCKLKKIILSFLTDSQCTHSPGIRTRMARVRPLATTGRTPRRRGQWWAERWGSEEIPECLGASGSGTCFPASDTSSALVHLFSVEQFNDKSLAKKKKDKQLYAVGQRSCVWPYYVIEPLGALIGNLLLAFSEQLRTWIWYTTINLW